VSTLRSFLHQRRSSALLHDVHCMEHKQSKFFAAVSAEPCESSHPEIVGAARAIVGNRRLAMFAGASVLELETRLAENTIHQRRSRARHVAYGFTVFSNYRSMFDRRGWDGFEERICFIVV
jgi:hypothetical protein